MTTPATADSYRDELAIADGGMVLNASLLSALKAGGRARYLPVTEFVLGSPIVHALHGNLGRAAGAAALRGGSLIATYGALRWCLADGDTGAELTRCVLGTLTVGLVLIGGAVTIDYAVLAGDHDQPAASSLIGWSGRF